MVKVYLETGYGKLNFWNYNGRKNKMHTRWKLQCWKIFFPLIEDVLGALKGKSEEMDGWRGNEIEGKWKL